ncbi:hypothetical protein [Gordonia sp. (in: high G+C Gram-positive bacteria)]|uniref:hypothetical protein n=1 Tax=Gordonia sp. (in: high G+C Gram-positive bacteria) TaxID=84139 RepID=UPI00333F6F27
MTWGIGRSDVQLLLADKDIERIDGDAANGAFLLDAARLRLESARTLQTSDPVSSFEIAYEGVRHAATALLTQQGLRPTSNGGHRAICRVVVAQFGPGFDFFNRMRQIRNTVEYQRGPGALEIQAAVVDEAMRYLGEIIDRSERLLPELPMWRI